MCRVLCNYSTNISTGGEVLQDDEIRDAYKEHGAVLAGVTRPLLYQLNWSYGEHQTFLLEVIWMGLKSFVPGHRSIKTHLVDVARRRAVTEYRNWDRMKHRVLNDATSTDRYVQNKDGKLTNPVHQIPSKHGDPFDGIWTGQLLDIFREYLSPLESRVLDLHLAGYRYKSLARVLGVTPKAADLSLSRLRRKIMSIMNALNADEPIPIRRDRTKDMYREVIPHTQSSYCPSTTHVVADICTATRDHSPAAAND